MQCSKTGATRSLETIAAIGSLASMRNDRCDVWSSSPAFVAAPTVPHISVENRMFQALRSISDEAFVRLTQQPTIDVNDELATTLAEAHDRAKAAARLYCGP
jgi:hypothetical protein